MTQLEDDLRGARALIDTPEKFAAYGENYRAPIYSVTSDYYSFDACVAALRAVRPRGHGFKSTMVMFDRALAAATEAPNG